MIREREKRFNIEYYTFEFPYVKCLVKSFDVVYSS